MTLSRCVNAKLTDGVADALEDAVRARSFGLALFVAMRRHEDTPSSRPLTTRNIESEPSIKQAVLDRLGEMVFLDGIGAFDVGDGSGDSSDLVVCAGAEAQFVHRLLH